MCVHVFLKKTTYSCLHHREHTLGADHDISVGQFRHGTFFQSIFVYLKQQYFSLQMTLRHHIEVAYISAVTNVTTIENVVLDSNHILIVVIKKRTIACPHIEVLHFLLPCVPKNFATMPVCC